MSSLFNTLESICLLTVLAEVCDLNCSVRFTKCALFFDREQLQVFRSHVKALCKRFFFILKILPSTPPPMSTFAMYARSSKVFAEFLQLYRLFRGVGLLCFCMQTESPMCIINVPSFNMQKHKWDLRLNIDLHCGLSPKHSYLLALIDIEYSAQGITFILYLDNKSHWSPSNCAECQRTAWMFGLITPF